MRVVIVEDQALLREGLARLFQYGGHDVAATLGDALTILPVIDEHEPDLGFGYLLKDRVLDVDEFLSAAQRVASGGSALDPSVVERLLRPSGDLREVGHDPVH